ncbi:heme lyase CcmF/NrfE family subunit [Pseudomonas sp. UBA6276]|uniref:heme lyase CcmF/NrfE family subunit n=1 Tax=Pseudomonas sp. UBA6276 TaxID=1947324 RepID=UPI00257B5528|nr:heme lyase CcmF/NrfE family subunit [Pseudomonas sp. UBA6276]
MVPELGHLAMILALCLALVQASVPLVGAWRGDRLWMSLARPAAWGQFTFLVLAFACLAASFLSDDFSVRYVAENSNSALPWYYKFSAVWGAHEGSLLLWALILGGWTFAVSIRSRQLPQVMLARVLAVMGMISVGFLLFLILTSNPFTRVLPQIPANGRDLNPLLQDIGLIVHPPMLYMGYVGFSVAFAFAIAALLGGKLDAAWARWSRPWTMVAWSFLGIGITLGSWWAYYELGWGGWWFWDPVENASFMPWLAGAALIHSQAVTEKRGSFASWTLLLAIAAFALSLLGTFLVRSGVLTSVHSFAADPSRGTFILIFLALVIGGALLLYALRAGALTSDDPRRGFLPTSRETLLLANNLLLAAACGMVLLGTLYPLLADALGLGKVSVGPPYFGTLFVVLMAPLVALLPFGPLVNWQRDQASRRLAMLAPWAGLALLLGVIAYFMAPQGALKTAAGVTGAAWVALGTGRFVWTRLRGNGRFTAEMVGMLLAHGGVAVFLAGALLVEALNVQREVALAPGQSLVVGTYEVRFEGVDHQQGPNYVADRGHLRVFQHDRQLALLHPEKRLYASGGQVMTEAGIHARLNGDVYVALGESLGNNAWAVRVHIKPFVRWIWLGALLMALGGFVTAADRRFRRP